MKVITTHKFLAIFSHRLFKNTAWLLGTEITGKLARVLTVLALAAFLDTVTYGVVMLTMACHDLFRITLRCGPGSQVIQCSNTDVISFTRNGAGLQWIICGVLSVIQFLLAFPIGSFYQSYDVQFLLQCLAPVYLFYPLTSSNVFLIQRANNMRYFSLWNGACLTFENLVLALCLWLDFGIYAVLATKYLGVLLWTFGFYIAPVKSFGTAFELAVFKRLFRTSSTLFFTEFSKSLKGHADLFIAGKLLLPEVFGLYAFAKSVSIGLSQSLINAFSNALFPHVCALNRDRQQQSAIRQIILLTSIMGVLLLSQAAVAPFYVPILFGERWIDSVAIVQMLCLASVGTLIFDIRCLFLRSSGAFTSELKEQLVFSIITLAAIMILMPDSALNMSYAVLVGTCISVTLYLIQTVLRRYHVASVLTVSSLEKLK
ncbi:oligosaccharide flippase family protein [Alteromonas facilis]|uniref:oligosaccharide flippase family protein n=1 Tax=Alteromonas facilis TaxID=2048004 RepID=UPI000C2872D6|nr:oligosaccharide flippase family protein [Alteromonas facilis]